MLHNIYYYTYSDTTEFGLGEISSSFGVDSFGGFEFVTIALTDEGE